jgi:aspartyl-tRNA(Asn)/glutamyl-tRNA(Gln) amidotransferase subunit A
VSDLLELSAARAIAAIEARELSATELLEFYRERAQRDAASTDGDGLNCFTWVSEDAGEAVDGPLAGVPLAVKDLFCTRDVPSQSGSRILEGYLPPYTATAVERLTGAGAALLAKTNQDEFAMGSSTENSAFGPTLNPWDRACVPGGSSGGSAAAVAAGLAPWALGTDTGGSIRQPASLCGIVGLKPTYGSVSRYGMIAFASSLDQAGPLTRDVTDAALLFRHLVGRDACDATSLQFPEPIELPSAERLDGVRIGVPAELRGGDGAEAGIEPGVREAFERTLTLAQELGASVQEIQLPHAPHALSAYYVLAPSEASSNLARFDGVRYGLRAAEATDLLDMYTRTRHDGFGAEVKRRIMLGTYALSSGYYDAYYASAQRVRTKLAQDFRAAYEQVDLILTPTAPGVAFALGEKTADPWAMYLSDYFTVPMSLAGIPAISIPCGLSGAGEGLGPGGGGLPVGLQITGPAFSENRLLDAAFALERAIGFGEGAARV